MRYSLLFLVLLPLLLTACAGSPAAASPASTPDTSATLSAIVSATLSVDKVEAPAATSTLEPSAAPTAVTTSGDLFPAEDLTRSDAQGAVEVDVTPGNLSNPGNTLDFEVGLNTHSVNLDMDFSKLATLKTDTGLTVNATSWNGGSGGHHVSGTLIFPAQVEGKSILDGTKVLTLLIQNVDAPERAFTWEMNP